MPDSSRYDLMVQDAEGAGAVTAGLEDADLGAA
jgi:hypothetical protein